MTRGRSKLKIINKFSKATLTWKYTSLEELYTFLNQRIEAGKTTVIMTQDDYDSFSSDLDYADGENESYFANFFRPTTDQTDKCNLEWVFAGKLLFKIKIKN